jgi:hypothetical protein
MAQMSTPKGSPASPIVRITSIGFAIGFILLATVFYFWKGHKVLTQSEGDILQHVGYLLGLAFTTSVLMIIFTAPFFISAYRRHRLHLVANGHKSQTPWLKLLAGAFGLDVIIQMVAIVAKIATGSAFNRELYSVMLLDAVGSVMFLPVDLAIAVLFYHLWQSYRRRRGRRRQSSMLTLQTE